MYCTETSTKLYVHKFGFWPQLQTFCRKASHSNSEPASQSRCPISLVQRANLAHLMRVTRILIASLNLIYAYEEFNYQVYLFSRDFPISKFNLTYFFLSSLLHLEMFQNVELRSFFSGGGGGGGGQSF